MEVINNFYPYPYPFSPSHSSSEEGKTVVVWDPENVRKRRKSEPLLVIINPTSGIGNAKKIFNDFRKEFIALGTKTEIVITKKLGHAQKNLCKKVKKGEFPRGVVVFGGDGTVAEVFRGILEGESKGKSKTCGESALKKIPVAHIPVGSGNGLFSSIAHQFGVSNQISKAFLCALPEHGRVHPLDFLSIQTSDSRMTAFLSVCWGLVADIDINSEQMRFLGDWRFTLQGVVEMLKGRHYKGTLYYLPGNKINNNEKIKLEQFKKVEGSFSFILAANTSHIAKGTHTAPGAGISDGWIHLIFAKAPSPSCCGAVASRYGTTKTLFGLEDGSYLQQRTVNHVRTRAFCIVPKTASGTMTVDGEKIPTQSIRARMWHAAARVFVP